MFPLTTCTPQRRPERRNGAGHAADRHQSPVHALNKISPLGAVPF